MPNLDDAADYKEPYVAPYVPKGFRLEDSRPATPPGFVIDTSSGKFHFVKEFFIKGNMNDEERAYFLGALENWKHGQITLPELQRVAKDPDKYDSYGQPIPAVPKVSDFPDLFKKHFELAQGMPPEALELIRMRFTADDVDKLRKLGAWPLVSAVPILPMEVQKLVDEVKADMKEQINRPSHYTQYKDVEVIDITEKLNFCRGNAVKYIARAGFKSEDTEIQDLQKALWYVDRQIAFPIDAQLSLLKAPEVEMFVGQMNYYRGNAVWLICFAGRQKATIENDLKDAKYAIQNEISRLEQNKEG